MKKLLKNGNGISLYIHIPFCKNKCHFCSFVIIVGNKHRVEDYIDAVNQEARHYKTYEIKTIYLGGGTPSELNIKQLKKLIAVIDNNFKYKKGCEFTIEVNPESIDEDKAKFLLDSGVNRVSLGIQSLNNNYLKYLGRQHNRAQAIKAFECLRNVGFKNINIDLMHSFPLQTKKEIEDDVNEIARLDSEHVSLYSLTIEERSKFFIKKVKLPDDYKQAEQHFLVLKLLEDYSFLQYEISNFSKLGRESQHNLVYWQGEDYIGLGVGAHSHIKNRRFWNTDKLHSYISTANKGDMPTAGDEFLNNDRRIIEDLLFGLRMLKGIDIAQLEMRYGCLLPKEKLDTINLFVDENFLEREGSVLKATGRGRLVLDELCQRLI